jgi:hypothetical protein
MSHTVENPATGREPVQAQKFFVTRNELEQMFGSAALFRQLVDRQWIKIVRSGKRGRCTLYCFRSALIAADRIRAGELP